jgi:hypothetical protein
MSNNFPPNWGGNSFSYGPYHQPDSHTGAGNTGPGRPHPGHSQRPPGVHVSIGQSGIHADYQFQDGSISSSVRYHVRLPASAQRLLNTYRRMRGILGSAGSAVPPPPNHGVQPPVPQAPIPGFPYPGPSYYSSAPLGYPSGSVHSQVASAPPPLHAAHSGAGNAHVNPGYPSGPIPGIVSRPRTPPPRYSAANHEVGNAQVPSLERQQALWAQARGLVNMSPEAVEAAMLAEAMARSEEETETPYQETFSPAQTNSAPQSAWQDIQRGRSRERRAISQQGRTASTVSSRTSSPIPTSATEPEPPAYLSRARFG